MWVKMLNGNVEDVYDFVGKDLILRGVAVELKTAVILKAEDNGGVAATAAIELAIATPKTEHAVVKFLRTFRSR